MKTSFATFAPPCLSPLFWPNFWDHRVLTNRNYIICREKDAEINREREELEQVKRNLERQLREVEEEMDIQRQELSLGYEEAMRKREHEFRVQSDEMRGTVLSHELKASTPTKHFEKSLF